MGRRTLLLIASILVAAVGTALIGLYVRGADSRAQESVRTVRTLVATKDIQVGTPLEQAKTSMGPADVPKNLVGAGFSGADASAELTAALKDQVVKTKILANQVIQTTMFAKDNTAVENGITKQRGVAIEMTDPARATGLLIPGSTVTIYETDTKSEGPAREVVGNALVMRIGNEQEGDVIVDDTPTSDGSEGDSRTPTDVVPRTIVTLDLTIAEAAAVIGAQARGELYFAVHKAGT